MNQLIKNIIKSSFDSPYTQCKLCKNYKDVRTELAYLDDTGYFCLHCAETKEFVDLKIVIRTSLASLNAYYWEPDSKMVEKYKRILKDLGKIRRYVRWK